jgi:hypothetical protein
MLEKKVEFPKKSLSTVVYGKLQLFYASIYSSEGNEHFWGWDSWAKIKRG